MEKTKMDKHSWGNSQAAIDLITMLEREEYIPFAKSVRSRLTTQWQRLDALMKIEEPGIRKECLISFHNLFKKRINEILLPEELKTHILCVATSRYRLLASIDGRIYLSPTAMLNKSRITGKV